MANIYDVALEVRFVPFSKLLNRISGTPYIERGLSSEALDVPSFDEELERGYFTDSPDVPKANIPKPPARAEQPPKVRLVAFGLAGATQSQRFSEEAKNLANQGSVPLSDKVYALAASARG